MASYVVRPLVPGEVITDTRDRIVYRHDIVSRAFAIWRDNDIAGVFFCGELFYSHEDNGVVREFALNLASSVSRLKELIGDA